MHPAYAIRVFFRHMLDWFASAYLFAHCIEKCGLLHFSMQEEKVKKNIYVALYLYFCTIIVNG